MYRRPTDAHSPFSTTLPATNRIASCQTEPDLDGAGAFAGSAPLSDASRGTLIRIAGGIELAKVRRGVGVRVDLGDFETVGGIELAKVDWRVGVRVDLGDFDAVGGIELAKVRRGLAYG
jgi:hypothetical protein